MAGFKAPKRLSRQLAKKVTDGDELKALLSLPTWDEAQRQAVLDYAGAGGGKADFFTPRAVADFMAALAAPFLPEAPRVLDPAAGIGRLLWAVQEAHPGARLRAGELNWTYREALPRLLAGLELSAESDFLQCAPGCGDVDLVVMNPPFAKQKGVHPAGLEVEFTLRAMSHLKEGGVLVALLPDGVLSNVQAREWRKNLLEEHSLVGVISLPKETFLFSGTGVKTSVLVVLKGKHPATLAPDGRRLGDFKILMAVAEKVGWDSRGRACGSDLKRVLDEYLAFVAEQYLGVRFLDEAQTTALLEQVQAAVPKEAPGKPMVQIPLPLDEAA